MKTLNTTSSEETKCRCRIIQLQRRPTDHKSYHNTTVFCCGHFNSTKSRICTNDLRNRSKEIEQIVKFRDYPTIYSVLTKAFFQHIFVVQLDFNLNCLDPQSFLNLNDCPFSIDVQSHYLAKLNRYPSSTALDPHTFSTINRCPFSIVVHSQLLHVPTSMTLQVKARSISGPW